ncbi:hypothetical protein Q0F98_39230 [Paenibacillus amylolyticus]|uniref:hypothetical protein n=1 Tax=Paenibacillus sp. FSL R7-0313 TaxID=2954532 RepID=UPI0030D8CF7C|nr:hypothetical protein Q0F98_39230 [Paenibacillus amylolyticus]
MRFQNKSGVRRAAIQSRLPAGVTAQLRTDGDSDYVFMSRDKNLYRLPEWTRT